MTTDALGILYHPTVPAARLLADDLRLALQQQAKRVWVRSAWDEGAAIDATDTDLMICIGGDGTVMRAARIVIPRQTPIIGVNMGRLGFLSEINPEEALPHLRQALAGDARVEYRTMLRAEVTLPDGTRRRNWARSTC
ncbi:MAG: NAD(+)/NADH kinase [Dehalococcoidia bacterium]